MQDQKYISEIMVECLKACLLGHPKALGQCVEGRRFFQPTLPVFMVLATAITIKHSLMGFYEATEFDTDKQRWKCAKFTAERVPTTTWQAFNKVWTDSNVPDRRQRTLERLTKHVFKHRDIPLVSGIFDEELPATALNGDGGLESSDEDDNSGQGFGDGRRRTTESDPIGRGRICGCTRRLDGQS